jgi:hypothetical protein
VDVCDWNMAHVIWIVLGSNIFKVRYNAGQTLQYDSILWMSMDINMKIKGFPDEVVKDWVGVLVFVW